MSIFEYDKELEEKKLRKAEYEYGFSEGKKLDFRMPQWKLPDAC